MERLRPVICLICAFALAAFMAACAAAGDGADEAAEAEAPEGSAMELDLDFDTLRAETEFGTAQAERAADSYVGPVSEGRAIGVALLDDDDGDQSSGRQIVAYLYDGGDLAAMIGDLDPEGEATLESGDLSDFDATVEVAVEDGAVSGAATFPGERPTPYTAEAATGVAGVYWADGTDEDPEVGCHWVVLSDGSQWGCICGPPFIGACCEWRF